MGIQLNPLLEMKVGGEDQSEKRWVGGEMKLIINKLIINKNGSGNLGSNDCMAVSIDPSTGVESWRWQGGTSVDDQIWASTMVGGSNFVNFFILLQFNRDAPIWPSCIIVVYYFCFGDNILFFICNTRPRSSI